MHSLRCLCQGSSHSKQCHHKHTQRKVSGIATAIFLYVANVYVMSPLHSNTESLFSTHYLSHTVTLQEQVMTQNYHMYMYIVSHNPKLSHVYMYVHAQLLHKRVYTQYYVHV